MGLVLSLLEALRPHLSLKALRRGWTTPQGIYNPGLLNIGIVP